MARKIIWDDFSEKDLHRKLGLKVKDRIFWVSREGLADLSSVFKTMLYDQYEESKKEIMPLLGKEAKEVLELFRCLFRTNAEIKKVDDKNVEILLAFADEYAIKLLTKKCTKLLRKRMESATLTESYDRTSKSLWTNDQKFIKLFLTAVRYRMKDMVRSMLPEIRQFDSASLKPFNDQLPPEVQKAISMRAKVRGSFEHEMGKKEKGDVCQVCDEGFRCYGNKTCKACKYCGYASCDDHLLDDDSCEGCRVCKSRNPRTNQRGDGCQCIDQAAIAELEKVGL